MSLQLAMINSGCSLRGVVNICGSRVACAIQEKLPVLEIFENELNLITA